MSDWYAQIRAERAIIEAANERITRLVERANCEQARLHEEFKYANVHLLTSDQCRKILCLPEFSKRIMVPEVLHVKTDHVKQRALLVYVDGEEQRLMCELVPYWAVMPILNE